ncbi:glycerophosphodiester phosphodiesterase family protein [Persicirhabdus sediminis]|nr:glycerophosphodiester phosphodiesterase family protein [Persicirhabdus sediminis]
MPGIFQLAGPPFLYLQSSQLKPPRSFRVFPQPFRQDFQPSPSRQPARNSAILSWHPPAGVTIIQLPHRRLLIADLQFTILRYAGPMQRQLQELAQITHPLRLKQNLIQFILIRLLFSAVATTLLAPVAAFSTSYLLGRANDSIISNYDIANFLLSPLGLGFLTVSIGFTFAILFFEHSGVIIIARSAMSHQATPSLLRVLWIEKSRFVKLLQLSVVYFWLYFIAAIPLLTTAGYQFLTLTAERDINYYLVVKPPEFWVAVALVVLAGTATAGLWIWLFLRTFLAVPILLFESLTIADSMRESLRRSRQLGLAPVKLVLIMAALTTALLSVVNFLLSLASDLFLNHGPSSLQLILIITGVLVASQIIWSAITSFFYSTTLGLSVSHFYLQSGGKKCTETESSCRLNGFLSRANARTIIVGGLVALLAIGGSVASGLLSQSRSDTHVVAVTAHRGSSIDAPENTLSALQLAIDHGADFCEIDVQITADGELVITHDTDLKRITGENLQVADLTREKRLQLDAGAWFSSEFKGEPLATLDDFIQLAGDDIQLNIELKFGPDRDGLIQGVGQLLRHTDFTKKCVITSLDQHGLLAMKAAFPELICGLIVTQAIGNITETPVDFLSLNAGQVDRSTIEFAQAAGKQIHVWTVNQSVQMHRMIDLGVDNIITDAPDILVALQQERQQLTPIERLVLLIQTRL